MRKRKVYNSKDYDLFGGKNGKKDYKQKKEKEV